jgi:predicted dehydrogenase
MESLRIGLVGCGRHAYHIIAPAIGSLGGRLVAACDKNEATLRKFATTFAVDSTFSDHRELLDRSEIDALVVVTGPDSHARIAMDAMTAGVDVFVEKTPCATAAEAHKALACENRTGRFTMVGFNRRYATAYRMAWNIARENGPVHLMQTRYHAQNYGDEKRFILGHLVHHLDLARYYLGEIAELQTYRVVHGPGAFGYTINLKTENGAIANIQSASMLNFNYPQEYLQVMGHGWEVIVDNHQEVRYNRDDRSAADRSSLAGMRLDSARDSLVWSQNRTMFPPVVYNDQGFRAEIEEFFACVREGRMPETTMGDAAKTMELLELFGDSLEAIP